MKSVSKIIKRASFILFLLCAISISVPAYAELEFNLDFGQDGLFEAFWPLKAGESVSVDIYVSNVPEPGLIAMGFKIIYDASKLQVVLSGTEVDSVNWPIPYFDPNTPGEIHMAGSRRTASGITGNGIKLGSVKFQCIDTGISEIKLLDRGVDCFVLIDDGTVLDEEFPDGIFLVAEIISPTPGDVNGDKSVDLMDLLIVLKILAKIDTVKLHINAGVNGDAKLGLVDAVYILQKTAKIR